MLLEQLRLDELDEAQKDRLVQEFGESRIADELAMLEADEKIHWDRLRSSMPTFREHEAQSAKTQPSRSKYWTYGSMLVAAACVLFGLYFPLHIQHKSDTVLLKGEKHPLRIYQQTLAGPKLLENGDELKSGDVLQIAYSAEAFTYGLIFSIDGRKKLTWHFPTAATGDQRLKRGQRMPLNKAYRIDDAPDFERFYFLRSDQPIDVSSVVDIINQSLLKRGFVPEHLEINASLNQFSILLKK